MAKTSSFRTPPPSYAQHLETPASDPRPGAQSQAWGHEALRQQEEEARDQRFRRMSLPQQSVERVSPRAQTLYAALSDEERLENEEEGADQNEWGIKGVHQSLAEVANLPDRYRQTAFGYKDDVTGDWHQAGRYPYYQEGGEEAADRRVRSATRVTGPDHSARSKALQRRFEAEDELEAAQAASDANPHLESTSDALEEAQVKAEGAKGRFLPGDETGKYGRFGTPTPPEASHVIWDEASQRWIKAEAAIVRRMEGPDFSGLAAMEEELADRGAWLKSRKGDLDPASAAAGEHTQGPDYIEALREYNDLKREVEQKQREIAAFKIQDAGLQQDYSVGPSKEATDQAAQDHLDRQELIEKILAEQAEPKPKPKRPRNQAQTRDTPQPRTTPRGAAVKEQVDDGWGASGYGS